MNYNLLKKLIKPRLNEFVSLLIGWIGVVLFFNYFFFGFGLTNSCKIIGGFICGYLLMVMIKIIYQYKNIIHQKN